MAAKVAGLCSKGLWLSSFRAAGGEGEQIAGRSQTPAGRSVLGIATSAHSWFHTTAAAQRFAASRTEPCRVQRQGGKGNADPQRLAEYRAQLMRCWTGEGEDGTLIGQLERAVCTLIYVRKLPCIAVNAPGWLLQRSHLLENSQHTKPRWCPWQHEHTGNPPPLDTTWPRYRDQPRSVV